MTTKIVMGSLGAALLLFGAGCGGSGGDAAAQFDGLWVSSSGSSDDSCAGMSTASTTFIARLRATGSNTLDYVELDQADATTEICKTSFSVSGNVALLIGTQTCTEPDPTNPTLPAVTRTFTSDKLELIDNAVTEQGEVTTASGQTCSSSFVYQYTRLGHAAPAPGSN